MSSSSAPAKQQQQHPGKPKPRRHAAAVMTRLGLSRQARDARKEPNTNVVIFHLGSSTLRYNHASQSSPRSIPLVVAYPRSSSSASSLPPPPPPPQPQPVTSRLTSAQEAYIASCEEDHVYEMNAMYNYFAHKRMVYEQRMAAINPASSFFTSPDTVTVYTADNAILPNKQHEHEKKSSSRGSGVLFGEAALAAQMRSDYLIRKPICRGRFATSDTCSLRQCVDALEALFMYVLQHELKITQPQQYGMVLIIPDTFVKREMKEVMDIILLRFAFMEAFMHKESVLAGFGAGVSTGCIVDLGAQKTHVCCVHEGEVIPDTEVTLSYGGDDLTATMMAVMAHDAHRHHNPLPPDLPVECVNALKEDTVCMMVNDEVRTMAYSLSVPATSTTYRMNLSIAPLLTPHALFQPALLRPSVRTVLEHKHALADTVYNASTTVDYFADIWLHDDTGAVIRPVAADRDVPEIAFDPHTWCLRIRKWAYRPHLCVDFVPVAKDREHRLRLLSGRNEHDVDDDDDDDVKEELDNNNTDDDGDSVDDSDRQSVVDAIMTSIGNVAVGDQELRASMFKCIVLAGGTARIRGLGEYLEQQVRRRGGVDAVVISTRVDPRDLSWTGAHIVCHNSVCCNTLWMTPDDWEHGGGVRLLRETAPFKFDRYN